MWAILREFDPAATERCAVVLGVRNFVSPGALADVLQDAPCPAVSAWLEAGGPVTTDNMRRLAEHVPEVRWLMEDLVAIAPEEFPFDQVALSDVSESDEGGPVDIYRRLRERGKTSPLVLCSHHMLAQDVLMQSKKRPEATENEESTDNYGILSETIGTLLIDEAHLLETVFAAIFSNSFHPLALRARLNHAMAHLSARHQATARKLVKALEGLTEALRSAAPEPGAARTASGTDVKLDFYSRIAALEVGGHIKSLAKIRPSHDTAGLINEFKRADRVLYALDNRALRTRIDFSPVHRYPAIQSGHPTLGWAMQLLWDRCAQAALFSATLYLPTKEGPSASYSRWSLGIPVERAGFCTPVVPEWIIDSPTLHRIDPACEAFMPPDLKAPAAQVEAWHTTLARAARTIHDQARGGVLVLCTSYQSAAAVGAALSELGELVIVQGPNMNASACRERMIQLYRSGARPVWVGTGSAWTGIDLRDELADNPADDLLLTDLFITRVPFGLNRTITHHTRKARIGFQAEISESLRTLLQGLGRLIRRPGLAHRHIWMGDPRLGHREHAFMQPMEAALKRYPKKKVWKG